ncbi:cytochrome c biogenesis protein [Pontiella sulfatireligans]|uniref:Cytochrome c biogenesis protein CcsA n=1 Tax=Pontiella sulfatireligans TaxID=2750658 RepID=A0A6C2UTG4_9BACT|nr:cytochrome c biogenesis protein CcsA [Pontiella sulfatireligans]VGO22507.1 Cytochrome c biogenesis protein CcsA [Pontiella sulfatireligans]
MRKIIINTVVVLFAVWFFQNGVKLPKESADEFQVNAFGHLPVKYQGRKKPIDTLARNFLTVLSNKQSVRVDGEKVSATKWLLDNIAGRPEAMDYQVFRIENMDVLSSLGLEERKRFRYSYREILPKIGALDAASRSAYAKSDKERDLYDKQVMKVANKFYLYQNFMSAFEDPSSMPQDQLLPTAQRYMQLEKYSIPLVIPPNAGSSKWRPLMSALLANHPAMQTMGHVGAPDPMAVNFGVMLAAYREGRVELFNDTLYEYGALVQAENPAVFEKLSFETFYNRFGAFMKSAQLYLLVFVISCFGWLARKRGPISAALALMICAFIPHTFAIIARCFLSGYPPVTNLYSSAIFIGWASVLAGIVLEAVYRKADGMGNLVGGIAGFVTLLIAHFLAGDGDTMEQMRAVLDTRFWLATHVITVTLGYMATFVAGTIGVFYIAAGLLTRRVDEATNANMVRMMYGTVCFALLLSFVGTVLGGLWADDSWGRFWGWDPKENGALLIVIWNAILLHARYGKMVGNRGFAVMAVAGNIVTAWSWFGVNQLSVGLHSYGFTQSATFWLLVFVITQLAVIFAGLLPSKVWKSGQEG